MGEPQFRWTSSACTHVGMVRENNEDAILDLAQRGLWAVADGMGGHARGDVASRMVVEALAALPAPVDLRQGMHAVQECLQTVNQRLRMEAALRDVAVIGSTVVALLACGSACACVWAGDSRLYLYRDGRLQQVSRDHSHAEEMKASGLDGGARNLITRAVGAMDALETDAETFQARDGDMFLLCSDGLSNEVSEADMQKALVAGNCRQAAEVLIEMALHHGGRDNVSAVVARLEDLHSSDKTLLNPAL